MAFDQRMNDSGKSVVSEGTGTENVPTYRKSNPKAQVPLFPTLLGEYPVLLAKTVDGNAMLTNFRLCVCERRSFINLPLMMIAEAGYMERIGMLKLSCKDGSTYVCTFATAEDCRIVNEMLREKVVIPSKLEDLFAFQFYKEAIEKAHSGSKLSQTERGQIALCHIDNNRSWFDQEVLRLGFDTNKHRIWKMSHANENFEFCATYPKLHILPATVDDEKLKECTDFRAGKRFPSVVWRDRNTGVVLIRSSQPLPSFLGLSYFSNEADVFLLEEIVKACIRERDIMFKQQEESSNIPNCKPSSTVNLTSTKGGDDGKLATGAVGRQNGSRPAGHVSSGSQGSGKEQNGTSGNAMGHHRSSSVSNVRNLSADNPRTVKIAGGDQPGKPMLAIVDCRSRAMIWGNSFKGGGTEDESKYKCNIIHLDLPNIHSVRDSFNKMRAVCHTYVETSYLKSLGGTMWLLYISALLRGANIVVELMFGERRPVLVHCSDGWDRTAQIVSLAELLMDPYYRTIKGFQVLIEREWLQFGHKFAERGGHDPFSTDVNQQSPVFLQFLDCVHQLTLQYPSEFQFNEAYLVKMLKHSQACLFGTFLHNNDRERQQCSLKAASLWSLLKEDNQQFVNLLYQSSDRVLTAHYGEHDIVLWKSVYMAGLSPLPHSSLPDFCLEEGDDEEEIRSSNSVADVSVSRSRSVDDLSKINTDNARRNSDPSITQPTDTSGCTPLPDPVPSSSNPTPLLDNSPTAGGSNSVDSASSSHDTTIIDHHNVSSSSVEVISTPDNSPSTNEEFHSINNTPDNAAAVLPITLEHVENHNSYKQQALVTSDGIGVNGSVMCGTSDFPGLGGSQTENNKHFDGEEAMNLNKSDAIPLNICQTSSTSETIFNNGEDKTNTIHTETQPAMESSPIEKISTMKHSSTNSCQPELNGHSSLSSELNVSVNGDCITNPNAIPLISSTYHGSYREAVLTDLGKSKTVGLGTSEVRSISLLAERLAEEDENKKMNGVVSSQNLEIKSNNHSLDSSHTQTSFSPQISTRQNGSECNRDLEVTSMDTDQRKLYDLKQIAHERLASKNLTTLISADNVTISHTNGSLVEVCDDSSKDNFSKIDHGNSSTHVKQQPIPIAGKKNNTFIVNGHSKEIDTTESTDTLVGDLDDALRESPSPHIPCDQLLGVETGDTGYFSTTSVSGTINVDRDTVNGVNNSTKDSKRSLIVNNSNKSTKSSSPQSSTGSQLGVKTAHHPNKVMSRRVRSASGASRDLSISPSYSPGNWSDTGRLRHPSGGESSAALYSSRRAMAASVSTSTTDISDSCVGMIPPITVERQSSGVRQHLDVDSLTMFSDRRQDLLADLVMEKDRKISELESRLSRTIDFIRASRNRQIQQPQQATIVADEFLQNEPEGGEHSSLGTISNPASDTSWEQLEETEEKVVLWVPDDVVTHCAGCDKQFWFYRRKHHCRNCGKIFCSECRNYLAPMPNVYMKEPQRVCRRCHSRLMQLSPGASCDGRIPTLVADG